jgi:hypothetical protein
VIYFHWLVRICEQSEDYGWKFENKQLRSANMKIIFDRAVRNRKKFENNQRMGCSTRLP